MSSLVELVESVRAIPYGRPTERRPWDGVSPMPLACEDGKDFAAGDDPDAEKRALEERFCDPAVREPYIASLSPP